jgi:hypothetical protein
MTEPIKIDDKDYPISFGMYCFALFGHEKKIPIVGMMDLNVMLLKMEFLDFYTLFWCALKAGSWLANQEFTLTEKDVILAMEKDPALFGSMTYLYNQSQVAVDEKKKEELPENISPLQ